MAGDIGAVILAAGQGARLRDVAERTPKCLLRIGGKEVLGHQVEALRDYGVGDICLVIGAKGDVWNQQAYDTISGFCKRQNVRLILNFDNDRSQNSYSLLLAMRDIEETTILAVDGDLFFGKALLELACADREGVAIVAKRVDDLSEPGTRAVVDAAGKVIAIGKNIIPSTPSWHIHSGFIRIGAEYFVQFREVLAKEEYKQFALDRPLREFSERYGLHSMEINDGWVNINTPRDFEEAERMWEKTR